MSGRLSFGFSVFPYSRFVHPEEMADVVAEGEELGFDTVTLPEHLLPPRWPTADRSTKLWYDLPTLAGFLAGRTHSIRFVTSVLVVPYHPPIQLAKALATLDVMSGGRIAIGVGAGWMEAEFRRLRLPFAERGAMTDEYLRAMIELWTSEAPRFHGRYVSFEDVSFLPRPVQQPHVPIYAGGSGPRPFRRVAEIAQGWFPMTATPAAIAAGVAEIRRLRERSGRADEPLWVGFGFAMEPDPETARMKHNVDGANELQRRFSPADAIAHIEALAGAGVTFVPVGFGWKDAKGLRLALRSFAREVLPAFR